MNSIIRFASGLSTVENFARDVYIKSNLTIELDRVVKQLIASNVTDQENESRILIETPTVTQLCDIIEAIFLHGLKEKLSIRVSSVFGGNDNLKNGFSLDYWSIILILCHNEESKNLKKLGNISTSVGRCRAWLRSALNESLFRSYLDTLICDSTLLNGFYRSSAYIRDKEHTEMMRSLITDLDNYIFHLTIDNSELNCWSNNTFNYLGVKLVNEDSSLVVTALDAIHLISEDKTNKISNITKEKSNICRNKQTSNQTTNIINCDNNTIINETDPMETCTERLHPEIELPKDSSTNSITANLIQENNVDDYNDCAGNSLLVKSGWSTQPGIDDESYDDILESYSSNAVLASTPDISDSIVKQIASSKHSSVQSSGAQFTVDNDFEIIPKNLLLNSDDIDNQKFFEQLSKLAQESGLDEQDYKCKMCARPIGLIYGKSRLCHVDGYLYCSECHVDEESIIPSQIIYNWNFKKFTVAKHNKKRLIAIETEPIFDIKILSPLLYTTIEEMNEILDLRTQLFFLHAYLFTCQESIALKMRKLVWPREHLFEHIHLYAINDLLQVYNNTLAPILQQVISFARKHVFSCALCKLKGYYCEICKDSQILYPFDTDSTKRCESCKSVFHIRCFKEKYDKHSCPKCLRIAKKKSQLI